MATGSLAVTTQFTLPAGLASGTYLGEVGERDRISAINFVVGPASATPGTPALTIGTDSGKCTAIVLQTSTTLRPPLCPSSPSRGHPRVLW